MIAANVLALLRRVAGSRAAISPGATDGSTSRSPTPAM